MEMTVKAISANKIARRAKVTIRIKWLRQFKVRLAIASVIIKIGLAMLPCQCNVEWEKGEK